MVVGLAAGSGVFGGDGKLTDDMKRPNMPPSAKPIVPAMTVFAGQDSNAADIYMAIRH